jgi:hypothetical protein
MRGRQFRLGVVTALVHFNHTLTVIHVDVSMLRHQVKIKKETYSPTNNLFRRPNYYELIGRQNSYNARVQGSTPKYQLRRSNGTNGQKFGSYASGRRAHVLGGTTPRARHARTCGYSRFSEEASALPAARGVEKQGGRSQRHADHTRGFD